MVLMKIQNSPFYRVVTFLDMLPAEVQKATTKVRLEQLKRVTIN